MEEGCQRTGLRFSAVLSISVSEMIAVIEPAGNVVNRPLV